MNTITMETLRTWLSEGHTVTLVDVRPRAEYEEWAIPTSMHIDVYERLKAGDREALATIALPQHVPVVTLCGAGKISQVAAQQLLE